MTPNKFLALFAGHVSSSYLQTHSDATELVIVACTAN